MKHLAFDFGASHGRAILGTLRQGVLQLETMLDFPNRSLEDSGGSWWNLRALFDCLLEGLRVCIASGHGDVRSLAVDTWGIDYGLLDELGCIMGNPRQYRDKRTAAIRRHLPGVLTDEMLYEMTGMQSCSFNTLFQLVAERIGNPSFTKAKKLLFMPDLMNYLLTGVVGSEYSIAGTSQLLDARRMTWSQQLMETLEMDVSLMPELHGCCTSIGPLVPILHEHGALKQTEVIRVTGHDTQAAISAIPARADRWAYISCGTWTIMGVELDQPLIGPESLQAGFSNEVGLPGRVCFQKLIPGLWLMQECVAHWEQEGLAVSHDQMAAHVRLTMPFQSFIDPLDETFQAPGGMPERIGAWCDKTGQVVPHTHGEIATCIFESLAMVYCETLQALESMLGYRIPVIHLVGGGANNQLLCQFAANAMNRTVVAGPAEATAIGNILQQAIATGSVKDFAEARSIVARSFPVRTYEPYDADEWAVAHQRYLRVVGRSVCAG